MNINKNREPPSGELKVVSGDDSITVGFVADNLLAVAEASRISTGSWYFNRLSVPCELRERGVATKLVQRLVNELKPRKVALVCDAVPSGEMSRQQLLRFYRKFGFRPDEDDVFDLILCLS